MWPPSPKIHYIRFCVMCDCLMSCDSRTLCIVDLHLVSNNYFKIPKRLFHISVHARTFDCEICVALQMYNNQCPCWTTVLVPGWYQDYSVRFWLPLKGMWICVKVQHYCQNIAPTYFVSLDFFFRKYHKWKGSSVISLGSAIHSPVSSGDTDGIIFNPAWQRCALLTWGYKY